MMIGKEELGRVGPNLGERRAQLGPGDGSRQGGHSPSAAGLHRQVLFTTVGWFVGYYLTKRADYIHAKVDRELLEYVRHHPEDFKRAERKRIGELLEDFHPVR
ncbi:NADH dehydrogenase [ubiquinone] 1 subunit C2 [Patagioenas fasciata monilis]|uniref:NADH dehydrogenase [ubiquinone] 1 subunit C2 n=1 Tax=Patagioenas fasciata monilis TaxID=372326 RepID=A0A1V4KNB8_PATFA|nr:NADH dehydrogenase [ubiquinone] 1 subunit C2 [Patagioenas fasciata monilis]